MEAVGGKEIKFKNLFEIFVYGNYSWKYGKRTEVTYYQVLLFNPYKLNENETHSGPYISWRERI